MIKYKTEYRLNKKGAECFRSEDLDAVINKMEEQMDKKPNVKFTIQSRSCRLDRNGFMETDYRGLPAWGPWR